MTQIVLTPAQRKAHRAAAHHLHPVVMIGAEGATPAVCKEAHAALDAHGLIKVRVFSDDRAARDALFVQLAHALDAACVAHIGKLLVLWRPVPQREKIADEARKPGPRTLKLVKNSKRGGQRPEVRSVRVLGNERMSAGGKIKRARPKRVSVKKRQSA